jgi:hypothetical protein
VINLGFPGANTPELATRFDSALKMHPKIVVVMAVANDALNPAKLLPPEVSRKNLELMVNARTTPEFKSRWSNFLSTIRIPTRLCVSVTVSPTAFGVRAENAPETDDTYPAKLRSLLRADHRASGRV